MVKKVSHSGEPMIKGFKGSHCRYDLYKCLWFLDRFLDPRQEKSIRMTNLYDTDSYGQDVTLEKHKQPSR